MDAGTQLKLSILHSIWPIKKGEYAKFIYTALMMIFTVYGYSILRSMKDALVISKCGAETLSAIELYGVIPCTVLIVLLYAEMIDLMSRIAVYNLFIWFFSLFVLCFGFILYPNAQLIHPDMSEFVVSMPHLKYLFIMLENWSFSLFYILTELYGGMLLSLLFWQMANQITYLHEASRFYPLFGFMAQIGLLFSGFFGKYLGEANQVNESMERILQSISLSIIINAILMSFCLNRLSKVVGYDLINAKVSLYGVVHKREKISISQSIKYILSSRYIGLIALLVVCYGVSINLVESIWRKVLEIEFPNPNSYSAFISKVQIATSIVTAISMLFGAYFLSKIKWRAAAIIAPLVTGVTGAVFFLTILSSTFYSDGLLAVAGSTMMFAALMGAAQNVLARGIKYSFFEGSKEMSYIVLEDELKSKGKAVADAIGGRFGKSGGAMVQQILLTLIPSATLISLAPEIASIFVAIICLWSFAVFKLSKRFEEKKMTSNLNA